GSGDPGLFRKLPRGQLIAGLSLAIAGYACLRDVKPPAPPAEDPPVSKSRPRSSAKAKAGKASDSAHDLFISALTCVGAPIYADAIGVELRDATATIDRACAPLRGAAFGLGANVDDEEAYLDAVRRTVELRAQDLTTTERRELLELFDKGLHA